MSQDQPSAAEVNVRSGERAARGPFLKWFGLLLAAALALAAAATFVQEFWAPIFLFSVVLGVLLGTLADVLARGCRMRARTRAVWPLILAALLLVVALHYFSYLRARNAEMAELQKHGTLVQTVLTERAKLGPPPNFVAYLQREAARGRPVWTGYHARGAWVWVLWLVDALLLMSASVLALWTWQGRSHHAPP